jgi:DNA-binding Xre family transcriptional regulator
VYTARGPVEGEDWGAVAAVVNERMASRRVGQQELAQLSGVSVSTLRQVQHGAGRRVQNKTLTAISRALGWPDDHLSVILLATGSSALRRTTEPVAGRSSETAETLHRLEECMSEIRERLAAIENAVLKDR